MKSDSAREAMEGHYYRLKTAMETAKQPPVEHSEDELEAMAEELHELAHEYRAEFGVSLN